MLNSRNVITRKAKNNRVYIFSGLIRCDCCGVIMSGKYTTNTQNVEYYYYRCNRTLSNSCPGPIISERKLEKYLLENVTTELEKFIVSVEAKQPVPKKKKSDSAKLKEQLRRVNVSYQAGNMDDNEYLAKTKEIKAMIEKASIEEAEITPTVNVESLKDFLNSGFEKIYDTLTAEEKQILWKSIISEIRINKQQTVSIKFKG